jgi:hypothetical protein
MRAVPALDEEQPGQVQGVRQRIPRDSAECPVKPVILKPERKVPFGFRKEVEQPDEKPATSCTAATTERSWQPYQQAPASPTARENRS